MKFIKIGTAILGFVLVFLALQRLVTPKFASPPPGATDLVGGLTREYYRSDFDHDVLFIGCCQVWSNFSTVALWEHFGITSHIRGNATQTMWQSYYLLRDALRFETPEVVVLSVLAMQHAEPQGEPLNRLVLDGMRWSRVKFDAIGTSRMEDEGWLSWFFPFFRYKDRWREIGMDDFRFFFNNPRVSINGFVINAGVFQGQLTPWDLLPYTRTPLADYTFGDKPMAYLQRIADLAVEYGFELVLIKAPTLLPYWPHQWETQIVDFAARNNLLYVNLIGYIDAMGLDFARHTFNDGQHLNVWGAEVAARFLGEILVEAYHLPSRWHEPDTAERWQYLSGLYYRVVARQLQEIADYGAVQNWRHE